MWISFIFITTASLPTRCRSHDLLSSYKSVVFHLECELTRIWKSDGCAGYSLNFFVEVQAHFLLFKVEPTARGTEERTGTPRGGLHFEEEKVHLHLNKEIERVAGTSVRLPDPSELAFEVN
ncbi:hypothetical protein BDQ17DRAFT_1329782 [Cyathus striatus]|nr:hypothetical protein BDQ17DRAFT_1329782 [Cyathus striatus]